ncbi:YcxB family protein [Acidaminobacter sp. JC074]|uniref:YcxB family protein n=1 Tax=Acidaminobacter sp. JC074 TaxID=2530199 RepID=UPI001F11088A|nr:YcxB family protein [Acidaminobacter sp. JC074]MCH4886949.1 YcxB family protein [Acidaminobacter sp. JC074]
MTLNYLTDEDDWLAFQIYHMKHSKSMKKSSESLRYIGFALTVLIAYVMYRRYHVPIIYWFFYFGLSITWVLKYPKYIEKNYAKQARNMLSEDENRAYLGKDLLKMDDHGLTLSNDHRTYILKWSVFNKVCLTEEHIFIYDSSVSACIIPASAFENADAMKSFYEHVEDKISLIQLGH